MDVSPFYKCQQSTILATRNQRWSATLTSSSAHLVDGRQFCERCGPRIATSTRRFCELCQLVAFFCGFGRGRISRKTPRWLFPLRVD
ncbi:hypothetical protein EVAR_14425_1 [Eumeta japonica]|uniref:Uncharacterized protein n=1 Tax=Eumeta variegata TaxID=151549 RepID=A0A4C1TX94_EUMVA|nr:hypothetical protein EVAR_14425_1 [Eumeta japonica]